MGTASLVSSMDVHCHVSECDASSAAGVEGVCASPTEGTCTAIIMSVCGAIVFYFTLAKISKYSVFHYDVVKHT